MFKRITIELEGPICDCNHQNLSWQIGDNEDDNPELFVICQTCGTELYVPYDDFVAAFQLDEEYPNLAEVIPLFTVNSGT